MQRTFAHYPVGARCHQRGHNRRHERDGSEEDASIEQVHDSERERDNDSERLYDDGRLAFQSLREPDCDEDARRRKPHEHRHVQAPLDRLHLP